MNKYLSALTMLVVLMVLGGCKNDKPDEPNNFEGIYYEEGTSDRSYLEQVGNKVLSYIKSNDQRGAITALHGFTDYCERYPFPENFYDNRMADESRAVADALEAGDYMSLSRAVTNFVYNLARFKGLYQAQPDAESWVKIENRESVTFRFWLGNNEYNINITGQGSTWKETVTDGAYSYTIEVPQVLDFTMLAGSTASTNTLLTAKIETDGKDGDHLNVRADVRFGNLEVDSKTKVQSTKMSEDAILYVHDTSTMYRTTLVSTTAEITGSGLCSISAWRNASKSDNPLVQMASSAKITTMILNSLQIKASITDMRAYCSNAGIYWDKNDATEPKSKADAAAKTLMQCTTGELRYSSDDNQKVRGTLGWESYMTDDYEDYASWSVRPTITFVADGGAFDFESYFGGRRFMSIENTINNLANTYRSYWK